jgi:hypothetical protein
MSASDPKDPLFDSYEDLQDEDNPKPVICKRCRAGGLYWEQETNGKWILVSIKTNEVHKCKIKKDADISNWLGDLK